MENIQWMSDSQIMQHIGEKIKEWRLKHNLSQSELAAKTSLSLFTICKMEKGKGISFNNFLKIIRILNKLQLLEPFTTEEEPGPIEYDKFLSTRKKKIRASKKTSKNDTNNKSKPLW